MGNSVSGQGSSCGGTTIAAVLVTGDCRQVQFQTHALLHGMLYALMSVTNLTALWPSLYDPWLMPCDVP